MSWFIKYNQTRNSHGFGRIPDPPEPPDGDPEIEVGDYLKCDDLRDATMTMIRLADEGIETELRNKFDGKFGYWLEVRSIE